MMTEKDKQNITRNFHFLSGYDATCNPTIFTEFASAAFRFGHSLLKEQFKRMAANFVDRKQNVKLRDVFMNPGKKLFFRVIC